MIPVLGADAQRLAEAQRTRPEGAAARRARPRRAAQRDRRRLARPRDGRRRHARAARLRRARAARGARRRVAPVVAPRPRVRCLGARAILALALAGRLDRSGLASRPIPLVHMPVERRHARALRGAASRRSCCRSPTGGGSTHERRCCRFEQRHLPLPRRRDPGAATTSASRSQPGEFCLLAGLSGHGKSTLLRAACGLVPHFHGGTLRRHASRSPASTRASTGPRDLGGARRRALPGPRDAARDELASAPSSRSRSRAAARAPRRSRAGSRRSRSRSASTRCSTAPRTSSPAARSSASRSAPRSPAGPRLVLLDEPTSQLDPVAGDELIGLLRRLNQEWETTILLAEHRLERCLAPPTA